MQDAGSFDTFLGAGRGMAKSRRGLRRPGCLYQVDPLRNHAQQSRRIEIHLTIGENSLRRFGVVRPEAVIFGVLG